MQLRKTKAHTRAIALLGGAVMIAATAAPITATAGDQDRPSARHKGGNVAGVMDHLERLEEFGDRHGSRASGTLGYEASRDYVVRKLTRAGYEPEIQEFDFAYFEQLGPSTFVKTAPDPEVTYEEDVDYALMDYSGSGDVTAPVEPVDAATVDPSTSGCEDSDFAGFTEGNIALIRRGTCPFFDKAANAEEAGAAGAIIFNQGNSPDRTGVVLGTLGEPVGIPVVGTSTAIGDSLMAPGTEAHLAAETASEIRPTWNVFAETKGRRSNVVMAGAHLDSVQEGNGINDNGSGSAALLETAKTVAKLGKPNNRVRFAWWGAEESGLLGSEHYVADLAENQPGKFQNIALYLNFDMVGSPNYMLGVYDGDNSAFPPGPDAAEAPEGSDAIERRFHRFFEDYGSGSDETAFSGRSDYGPFIALNVPAGGLFTGAEGIKTPEQAIQFGGTAGEPYDECYHLACDDLGNLSRAALKANTGAIQDSVLKYSRSTRPVNGDSTGHEPPADEERRAIPRFDHGASAR